MQAAMLVVLTAIGIADLLISRQMTIAPVALLYVVAKIQADYAAYRFLKHGLTGSPAPFAYPAWYTGREEQGREQEAKAAPPSEPLPVPPLKSKAAPKGDQEKQPNPEPQAKVLPFPPPRQKTTFRPAPDTNEKTSPVLRAPRFSGKPHEVLGIQENAATGLILQAFRHWIKRYHPDQARQGSAASQAERTRQLTAAKQALLEKRRQLRPRTPRAS